MISSKGCKAETGASTLQRGDNLADIIANEAESSILGVLFDYSTKRELSVVCHGIRFIQNNQFDTAVEKLASTCKFLDFVAHKPGGDGL